MNQYRYDFSVIMAVYNVEKYLREAVDSLIHQTIGFSRIQLIMVDDGSKDQSGKICDDYQRRYPENIVVVHKENGGVSSARNAGISYVKGRYLNFMDSDDRFEKDAFKKVGQFFAAHEEEVDVACVPVRFFDGQTGEHQQNSKFELGKEVLDLFETPDVINLSVSFSFIRAEKTKGYVFDTRLRNMEDAKFILPILMKKMKLGLVGDTAYWYRKRSGGEESAVQSAFRRSEYYIPCLKYFSKWALDEGKEQFGEIPEFIQYEVMYELQWRFLQERVPEGVLDDIEKKEYEDLLFRTMSRISDAVILRQKSISIGLKTFLLDRKHGQRLGGYKSSASGQTTVWEFIKIDEKNGTAVFEGYHVFYGVEDENITPYLIINGTPVECEKQNRSHGSAILLGKKISDAVGFRGSFRLKKEVLRIRTAVKIGDVLIERNNIRIGGFFPVSNVYDHSYYVTEKHMVTMTEGLLTIQKKPLWIRRTIQECEFLTEIWKKNYLGGRKAVFGRLYYHFLKPFKRRNLWIISDRVQKADDNGEALFRYLQDNKPEYTRVLFAVRKDSPDYKRLSRIGECVNAMSFRHKLLHLLCDMCISSHADDNANPFRGHHDALRDLLQHQKFVFLQHGITQNDVSGWLNRYNQNIFGLVAAAKPEYKAFISDHYGYSKKQVWLTGFPRFDRLYHDEKKWITVMPTWRKYLVGKVDRKTGIWEPINSFKDSGYFQFYNELFNSDKLLEALDLYGYKLKVFLHPNMQVYAKEFHRNSKVEFLASDTSYRLIYANSNLILTDYSSTIFDFAFLRKPVLYCQFDKETFYGGNHHTTEIGYFDYERDGFGEVTYNLEDTINILIKYVKNGCIIKDEYKNRIDNFFAFNDHNNCERVMNKILELEQQS